MTMVAKQDRHKIQALLTEAITVLCKNGLSFNSELTIEGLLAITLDKEDIFLVKVNELISSDKEKSFESDCPQAVCKNIKSSSCNSVTSKFSENPQDSTAELHESHQSESRIDSILKSSGNPGRKRSYSSCQSQRLSEDHQSGQYYKRLAPCGSPRASGSALNNEHSRESVVIKEEVHSDSESVETSKTAIFNMMPNVSLGERVTLGKDIQGISQEMLLGPEATYIPEEVRLLAGGYQDTPDRCISASEDFVQCQQQRMMTPLGLVENQGAALTAEQVEMEAFKFNRLVANIIGQRACVVIPRCICQTMKVGVNSVLKAMKALSKPRGHAHYIGEYVEITSRIKVFFKCPPSILRPEALSNARLTLKRYSELFHMNPQALAGTAKSWYSYVESLMTMCPYQVELFPLESMGLTDDEVQMLREQFSLYLPPKLDASEPSP